ncbi:hypothetical protein [Sorangium sp. So ce363]|uniref:hypothetical protein n=1 Tax=Sorangium sp. So ce363 TaxID=3133304 RepID=UPI003F5F4A05
MDEQDGPGIVLAVVPAAVCAPATMANGLPDPSTTYRLVELEHATLRPCGSGQRSGSQKPNLRELER